MTKRDFMTKVEFSDEANRKRISQFSNELHALLKKYKVTIELEETTRGYYVDKDINFSFDGYHDADADVYVVGSDLKLGNYITGEK
jgi:hypothetical protein